MLTASGCIFGDCLVHSEGALIAYTLGHRANRAQYSEVSFHGIVEDDVTDVALPSVQGEAEEEALDALAALTVADASPDVFVTPPQLDGELVTLTLLPRSRWQTLLNLEVIQQRNKPKEPPKPPEAAPFFLPTLPGVEQRFDLAQGAQEARAGRPTRRLERAAAGAESAFVRKLHAEARDGDCECRVLCASPRAAC